MHAYYDTRVASQRDKRRLDTIDRLLKEDKKQLQKFIDKASKRDLKFKKTGIK